MELSDAVYLILMLVFVVFGIFNDSKKKKKRAQTSAQPNSEESEKSVKDIFQELFEIPSADSDSSTPPPIPKRAKANTREQKRESRFKQSTNPVHSFESSLSLVTDFEGESSLKGYKFVNDDLSVTSDDDDESYYTHPVLQSLSQGNKQNEIQKAIIYSEIINRKY